MNNTQAATTPFSDSEYIAKLPEFVHRLNEILQHYSDKDWNYSRVRLVTLQVSALQCPYLLGCEFVDPNSKKGAREIKDVQSEVTWGEHHSSELGILELVSLRLNKALLAVVDEKFLSGGPPSHRGHPIIRLVKRQALIDANVPLAMWYEVQEVSGEEFDSR